MKVSTKNLSHDALVWLISKICFCNLDEIENRPEEIIESMEINLGLMTHKLICGLTKAFIYDGTHHEDLNPVMAAFRCLVEHQMGKEVDVPREYMISDIEHLPAHSPC